jgi:hypothetical protein
VKTESKKPKIKESALGSEEQRKFDEAMELMNHLRQAPCYDGAVDLFADDPYCSAFRVYGTLFFNILVRLATSGHPKAVRMIGNHACELVELIEELLVVHPDILKEMAARRADWPVMLCRHETGNKNVSAYLENVGLGTKCQINADGRQVAKYSLRTPINRFVWHELKKLRGSLLMMSDVPAIAAIKLDALPKLTKTTAKLWADKALLPYLTAMYEDFTTIPELSAVLARPGIKTRGQQRREIRKDVIRALQSLAPAS